VEHGILGEVPDTRGR